ncbi:hypothetical protein [Allonocardiopsis opalescens]|uniref:Uncharacterized protein n=1 Tax=Allonocardiopsis opalescens TaxID=1144618 RepID=A0A2T0PXE6_9ACTN|nr:hypothetical protein [Allonocardiopsis opalescens]PRX96205.1 hypothetical protein CLV72_108211 [Allonocardiopsis opalescens]
MNPDDERVVDLDDDIEILPDQTRDDIDTGWGEWRSGGDDDRYAEDRPPHWG